MRVRDTFCVEAFFPVLFGCLGRVIGIDVSSVRTFVGSSHVSIHSFVRNDAAVCANTLILCGKCMAKQNIE